MGKRTPVEKSIVRHKLKEIDKKWDSRKIRTKVASKIKKPRNYADEYRRSLGRDAQLALGYKRRHQGRYDEFGRELKKDN